MKLIIDIPEKTVNEIKDNAMFAGTIPSEIRWDVTGAIAKGTPLPKGHGRLKDTDAICKDIISALGIRDENYLLEAEKAIYKRIKNAPTIIEADKAESEDKG